MAFFTDTFTKAAVAPKRHSHDDVQKIIAAVKRVTPKKFVRGYEFDLSNPGHISEGPDGYQLSLIHI